VARSRGVVFIVAVCAAFLAVTLALNVAELPSEQRGSEGDNLVALIGAARHDVQRLRTSVSDLGEEVEELRQARLALGDSRLGEALSEARYGAGFEPRRGPGLLVSVDDGTVPPGGNPNDYVIHSQDVQAIANGLWAAGADAVAVNGERVLPTTALLCVGNTLLINGTVHAPPYEFVAVSERVNLAADFAKDPLVMGFAQIASQFGLGYSTKEVADAEVPAFAGAPPIRVASAGGA